MNLRRAFGLIALCALLFCGPAAFARGGGGGGTTGGGGGGHGGGFSSSGGGGRGGAAPGARGSMGAYGSSFRSGYPGGYRGYGYRPMSTSGRYPVYGGRAISSRTNYHPQLSRTQGTVHQAANSHRTAQNQRRAANGTTGRAGTTHGGAQNRTGQTQSREASGKGLHGNQRQNAANLSRTNKADRRNLTTRDGSTHRGNWARNNPKNQKRFGAQTQERLRNWNGHRSDLNEARQRNNDCHRHHHGHNWWHNHCGAIIFWDWGWWGWWDGWWYPAWGYDPYYQSYEYGEPIYGYDGMPPDEVIANVQSALQQLGYYTYAVDGKMGPLTQSAINRYQRDNRLPITGTIDAATAGSLGLQ